MKQLTSYEGLHCANCGEPMQGEFCHACGQSIHSVIKPIHGMLEDTLDIVFHVDGRLLHTLPPLFARPGFLTLEYFSGRRVRYIAPFRLMFVLSLLAFFLSHLAFGEIKPRVGEPATASAQSFRQATTAAQVRQALQQQLDALDASRRAQGAPALAVAAIDSARQSLRQQAGQRLRELGATPIAVEQPTPMSASAQANPLDQNWDPQQHPVSIGWLPDVANRHLQQMLLHLHANLAALSSNDDARKLEVAERITAGVFAVLPLTMFVLMPIFALLLKLVYLFRRRLYMEHLIVALHSHAFLFLSLLLGVSLHLFGGWLTPHAGWLGAPLRWLTWGLWLWAPTYLLIMQKRIYRQGWPMTVLKYLLVGWCYFWLLGMALGIAGLLGLAH